MSRNAEHETLESVKKLLQIRQRPAGDRSREGLHTIVANLVCMEPERLELRQRPARVPGDSQMLVFGACYSNCETAMARVH